MAVIETWFEQDLQKPVKVRYIDGNLFSHNGNGNRIGVVVTNNGEPVTLTGTVSGYAVLADGTTVPCTGTRSGNKASILIPAAAYSPGSILISIFLTDGTTVTTLAALSSSVIMARTGNQIDPGSVVTDWTNTINAAMQSVETAAANLGNIVATPYANLTFPVPLGKYTIYNNGLYRCISPIASSEAWTAAHWTNVKLGDDVAELKIAFNSATNQYPISRGLFYGETAITQAGEYAKNSNRCASKPIGLDDYDIVIMSNTANIIAYLSSGENALSWTDKIRIPKGVTARLVLKDFENPNGAAKSVLIDNLTMLMSVNAYDAFKEKYYYSYQDILDNVPSSLIENGWVYTGDLDRVGMLQPYTDTYSTWRRFSRPVMFGAGDVRIIQLTDSLSYNVVAAIVGKTATVINESEISNPIRVEENETFLIATSDNKSTVRVSFKKDADSDFIPVTSLFASPSLSHRVDAETYYNDCYYTMSNADSGDATIRVYSKDWTLLYTLPQESEHVGHANSQSLVGDKWYISDSGDVNNDPKLVHVYKLDGNNTEYLYDIIFNESDLTSNNYIFDDDLSNVYSVGAKRTSPGGPLENISVFVKKWILNTNTNTYDESCTLMEIPRFGYWQGLCKMGRYIYCPLSDVTNYHTFGIGQIDLDTLSFNIIGLGGSTLQNEEAEGMIPLDNNNAIIYSVDGRNYLAKLNNVL